MTAAPQSCCLLQFGVFLVAAAFTYATRPCNVSGVLFSRMSILDIVAREILDSRGNPTVEVDLHTSKGWAFQPLVCIMCGG